MEVLYGKEPASTPRPPAPAESSTKSLISYFHLTEKEAAQHFDVCLTSFKKICRARGLRRWPHRKFKSLRQKICPIEAELASAITMGPNGEAYRRRLMSRKLELEQQILELPKTASVSDDEVSDDDDNTDDTVVVSMVPSSPRNVGSRLDAATADTDTGPTFLVKKSMLRGAGERLPHVTARPSSAGRSGHRSQSTAVKHATNLASALAFWKNSIACNVTNTDVALTKNLFIELWMRCGPQVARATVQHTMQATSSDVLLPSQDDIEVCGLTSVHAQRPRLLAYPTMSSTG
jgi:hypothetical protein